LFLETATAVPESIVLSHLTTAGLAVALIQWLKKSRYFPWITQEKTRVMRLVAIVTAGLGTVGINYAWNAAGRELSFHIPTFVEAFSLGIAWAKSFITQEIVYRGTAKNGLGELLILVRAIAKAQGVTLAPGAVIPPKT
jgi:hypothetical protein